MLIAPAGRMKVKRTSWCLVLLACVAAIGPTGCGDSDAFEQGTDDLTLAVGRFETFVSVGYRF